MSRHAKSGAEGSEPERAMVACYQDLMELKGKKSFSRDETSLGEIARGEKNEGLTNHADLGWRDLVIQRSEDPGMPQTACG